MLAEGSSYIKIRPVAEKLKLSLPRVGAADLDIVIDGTPHTVPFRRIGADGYVSAKDLAEAFGVQPAWDKNTRTVVIP